MSWEPRSAYTQPLTATGHDAAADKKVAAAISLLIVALSVVGLTALYPQPAVNLSHTAVQQGHPLSPPRGHVRSARPLPGPLSARGAPQQPISRTAAVGATAEPLPGPQDDRVLGSAARSVGAAVSHTAAKAAAALLVLSSVLLAYFAGRSTRRVALATASGAKPPDAAAPSASRTPLLKYLLGSAGPSGYGSSTTARRVANDFRAAAKGKVAVITGCTGGIGKETALQLCLQGATVVMACRDAEKMKVAADDIRQQVPRASLHELRCDLADQQSVREFVAAFDELGLPCHYLINNAGVMACPRTLTTDGYELQFGTNHLGHFTLTNLLARHLAAAGQARVVNLASTAHSMAYPPQGVRVDDLAGERLYTEWGAYGQSKLANVLHAQELEARFQRLGADVRAYSVHPGVIATDLWRYSNPVVAPFMRLGINVVGKSIPQGAATTVYCALAPDLPPAYYADCNEGELSHPSFALDPQLRTKLWDASVELTGTDLKLDAAAEVQ